MLVLLDLVVHITPTHEKIQITALILTMLLTSCKTRSFKKNTNIYASNQWQLSLLSISPSPFNFFKYLLQIPCLLFPDIIYTKTNYNENFSDCHFLQGAKEEPRYLVLETYASLLLCL